jgi:hypothetical protein
LLEEGKGKYEETAENSRSVDVDENPKPPEDEVCV